jgi:hypothetical protein
LLYIPLVAAFYQSHIDISNSASTSFRKQFQQRYELYKSACHNSHHEAALQADSAVFLELAL